MAAGIDQLRVWTRRIISELTLDEVLAPALVQSKGEIMTADEQLRAQERKQARLKTGREVALIWLEEFYGPLPDDAVARVMAADDEEQLVEWVGRMNAPTLDGVFAG